MAIAKSGLLRGLTGKTAGLVMAKTKQGTIVREYAENITNPKTPAQEGNRRVFKAVVENVSGLNADLLLLYGSLNMPAYAKLVSMTMRNLGAKTMNSFLNSTNEVVPAMYNSVGVNNDNNKLGSLDLRRAEIGIKKLEVAGQQVPCLEVILQRGNFPAGTILYFGCDYAIGNLRMDIVSAYGRNSATLELGNARTGTGENTEKNTGFFENETFCGEGWKFIYQVDLGNIAGNLSFKFLPTDKNPIEVYYLEDVNAPYVNGQADYVYCTALLTSQIGGAVETKQGGLVLSSANFVKQESIV